MPILKPDMGEKVAGLQVGAGTLSRPGLAFQNDEDTGFASRSAGGISVVVDAVEVLSLTADGIAFPLLTAASVPFVGAAGVLTEDNAAFFFTNATNLLNVTGGVVTPAVGPTAAQQHTLPSVASDTVVLRAATQTLTAKTLTSPILGTQVTFDQTTADYTLTWTNPAAARAILIPDPGGTDVFVFRDMTQILINKTISLTSNTLTATSLQVLTAVSDETGTGALVFANTPTLVSPVLGTPTSGVLTNCTGLPAASVLAGTFGAGSYVITADLTVQDQLIVSGAGPHVIGGATSAGVGLNLLGFTGPSGTDTYGVQLTAPTIVGTPTNAATLRIIGAPTGATNNRALWVTDGGVDVSGAGASSYMTIRANVGAGGGGQVLPAHFSSGLAIGWNRSASEGELNFLLSLDGGGTIPRFEWATWASPTYTERMRLTSGGILALGTTATTGQAVLDQASTTAAIPVLVLEQRDVDQPFMFYDTTIGTGNATEAVGAKTLTTTHFVMVNIVGVGNRYFPVGTIA